MSAERPWKIYLAAIAIICLLVGVGVGWVAKPPKEVPPPGWVPPEEYETAQIGKEAYEQVARMYKFLGSSTTAGKILTLKEAETPWGSIWDMVSSGWPGVEEYDPDVEAQNVETYKQWLTEILGKPPEEVTGTLVVAAWAGLGREEERWWNNGPWGFKNIFPNVEIQWVYFEDEADLRAKLEMDPEWADIIEVCGSQWKLMEAGYLDFVDPSLVPLLAEMPLEWLLYYPFWYDNKLYGIVIEWGQSSLVYRIDKFEELGLYEKYPQYFNGTQLVDPALLFDPIPELEGKIWWYDSCTELPEREAIYYLTGERVHSAAELVEWTLVPEKWEQLEQVFYGLRPKIGKFFTGVEEAYEALQTGEAVAVWCWNDMYAAGALGPDWEPGTGDEAPVGWFISPVPGSWATAYCINSRLRETKGFDLWVAAHAFLNALIAPEACVDKIAEWFEGAPNRYAWDMAIDSWGEYGEDLEKIIEDMRLNDAYYYTVQTRFWIEPPEEVIRVWEEFWLEFKA